jgi:hypothetical protein
MLRDATQATLLEILDGSHIPYEYSKADNVLTLADSRSRILFRPVDDFERLRGTNLAWFGLDELTYSPEAAWLRLEGRLRDPKSAHLCGFAVWTPKGYDWVYQRFLSEPTEAYEVVIARPFENRFLLDKIPDFYDRLKRSYDDNFYQQEVLGQYLNMQGGLVYSSFTRNENVRDVRPNEAAPLLWALDFNVDPMCSVVAQVEGVRVQVLDEIVVRHASTREACEEFHRRFPEHRAGLVIYGDASGNNNRTSGNSDYHIVREYFSQNYPSRLQYKVPKSNPAVRERITLMNSKLRTAAGEVQCIVDRRCKELIKDFEQVSYKADSNVIDKDKDRKRTHLSDALGYLLWQECRSLQGVGERRGRLV